MYTCIPGLAAPFGRHSDLLLDLKCVLYDNKLDAGNARSPAIYEDLPYLIDSVRDLRDSRANDGALVYGFMHVVHLIIETHIKATCSRINAVEMAGLFRGFYTRYTAFWSPCLNS